MHGFVNLMCSDISRTGSAINTSCASGQSVRRKPDVIMTKNHLFFCALSEKAFGRNISNLVMGIVTERGRSRKINLKHHLL